jgi:hydroxymethylglutaryl-CoA lyase/(R)-citramalyl-CoA lyase
LRVTICDVGPRDGLQNEQVLLEPPVRAELVDRLAESGLPAIEAVSFVHPGRVPQMAGAEEVVAGIERRAGVVYAGLVLNFASGYAALEAGATVFEASVGGLGGCHFAPRATGNVATEDLVYLLHGEGVETGVDLDALIAVSEWLEGVLGRELPGQIYRAGRFAPVAG